MISEQKFRVETPYGVTFFENFHFQKHDSIILKTLAKKNFQYEIYLPVMSFNGRSSNCIATCSSLLYKHPFLNYQQILSSACLLVVTVCNIPASISVIFDVMQVPHMAVIVVLLQYIEMLMFVLMPSSLVVWKMWKMWKNRQSLKRE